MTTKATYISGMFRRLAPANEARSRIFGNRMGMFFFFLLLFFVVVFVFVVIVLFNSLLFVFRWG